MKNKASINTPKNASVLGNFLLFTFSVYLIYFHIARHIDITTKVRRASNLPQTSVLNISFEYYCIEYKKKILFPCAVQFFI